ncbi:TPA: E3 ubiquitin--protein ligase, partial [Morganella morganii]
MPLKIGNRFFPAEISNRRINAIVRSDTPPEVSLWEKIKAFFCSTNKPEGLTLIRQICHVPDETQWETVIGKFEQLKTLTYGGFKESVQVGRNGENHACILDENGDEMLSATFDKDTGEYTVKCQGYSKTNHLNPTGGWETELATDASEALWTDHSVTAAPQTAQSYEATWSAREEAAPAGE